MSTLLQRLRLDSWVNAITSLGQAGKDKRKAAIAALDILSREELEILARSDSLAAKVIERLPHDMTRAGWELRVPKSPERAARAEERGRELGVPAKVKEAMKLARQYGGAALVLGLADGQALTSPALPGARLAFVNVLNRYQIRRESRYTDAARPKFGEVELYRLEAGAGTGTLIHESRVIAFHGHELPADVADRGDGWGDSVLPRIYSALQAYHGTHDVLPAIAADFIQSVYKIKGLAQAMDSDDGRELLKARMEIVEYGRSVLRATMMDADLEDFQKLATPTQGLAELVDRVERRPVAEVDMPHTLLLGEAPGASLGEGGDSETRDWDDRVKAEQAERLEPALRRLYAHILAESGAGGDWAIVFRPLRQPTPLERAQLHREQAEADGAYIDRGVLSAEEVAESRFGGDEYSVDTALKAGTPRGIVAGAEDPELEDEDDQDEDLEDGKDTPE